MNYYVYILTNAHRTVLYTGVTNDLLRRVYEHKHHLDKGSFTAQYNVEYLVYYETTIDIVSAIDREKQIKGWSRSIRTSLWRAGIPPGLICTLLSYNPGDCHASVSTGSQ